MTGMGSTKIAFGNLKKYEPGWRIAVVKKV